MHRDPAESIRYRVIAEHFPKFLDAHDEGLPDFVIREFEKYLRCGQLEYGFAECQCHDCGRTHRVPFSCKRRGFRPSCLGRRMQDLSLHLVEKVIPDVATHQWVLTVPCFLKYRFGYDPQACSFLMKLFWSELSRSYRHRAKRILGLRSVNDAHAGSITLLRRTDSALRLSPHLHTLTLDGVYVRDRSSILEFRLLLPPPSLVDLLEVTDCTARRMLHWLESRDVDLNADEQPLLSKYLAASVDGRSLRDGRRATRLIHAARIRACTESKELRLKVHRFGLHAGVTVDAHDRQKRLHLCRYLTRPPLAQDRLKERSDGKLLLRFKRVWRDGTSAVVLTPYDLITRLPAAIPAPRFHSLRYHGVLSAHAKLRPEIVPRLAENKPKTSRLSSSCPASVPQPKTAQQSVDQT